MLGKTWASLVLFLLKWGKVRLALAYLCPTLGEVRLALAPETYTAVSRELELLLALLS